MSAEAMTPGLSVLCSPPSAMNNRTLQCDVGNPLPANTQVIYQFSKFSTLQGRPNISTLFRIDLRPHLVELHQF